MARNRIAYGDSVGLRRKAGSRALDVIRDLLLPAGCRRRIREPRQPDVRGLRLRIDDAENHRGGLSDAQALLAQSLKDEPDESVRSELQTVLDGKVIEDPKVHVPAQQ